MLLQVSTPTKARRPSGKGWAVIAAGKRWFEACETHAGTLKAAVPRLLATDEQWSLLVLRLTLALVIFPHGAQKLLGWFGGYGFSGTMDWFTGAMGVPYLFALLAVTAEFVGPLALAAGFLTRLAAFGIGSVMIGAVLMVHLRYGFFMDWGGYRSGEGFEFHLLALGIALALMVGGGGRFSADRVLAGRIGSGKAGKKKRKK